MPCGPDHPSTLKTNTLVDLELHLFLFENCPILRCRKRSASPSIAPRSRRIQDHRKSTLPNSAPSTVQRSCTAHSKDCVGLILSPSFRLWASTHLHASPASPMHEGPCTRTWPPARALGYMHLDFTSAGLSQVLIRISCSLSSLSSHRVSSNDLPVHDNAVLSKNVDCA